MVARRDRRRLDQEGLGGGSAGHASDKLVPEHFEEVRERRERQIDKNLAAIHERLVKEIDYWSDRHEKLKTDLSAGKDVRLPLENVRRTIDELTVRLETRTKGLQAMRHVVSGMPVVVGGALVIPAGLIAMRKRRGRRPNMVSRCAGPRPRREGCHGGRPQGGGGQGPSGDRCVR
jgi:hypothetical protein